MLCPNCKQDFATRFCPGCGYTRPTGDSTAETAPPPPYQQPPPIVINDTQTSPVQTPLYNYVAKNKWVAFFLCLFLGVVGFHRFYTGKIFTGILYLLSGGFMGIGVLIDLIMILTGSYTDSHGHRLVTNRP